MYLTPKIPTALLVIVKVKRVEDPPKHAWGYRCKGDVSQVLPCTKFLGGKNAPERHFNKHIYEFLPCSAEEEVVIFNLKSQQHGWIQCITLGHFESLPVVRNIVNLEEREKFYLLLQILEPTV